MKTKIDHFSYESNMAKVRHIINVFSGRRIDPYKMSDEEVLTLWEDDFQDDFCHKGKPYILAEYIRNQKPRK